MKKRDLYELNIEINSVEMIVRGLSNQLDEDHDRLTTDSLRMALNGVANYLERIAEDLERIDEETVAD